MTSRLTRSFLMIAFLLVCSVSVFAGIDHITSDSPTTFTKGKSAESVFVAVNKNNKPLKKTPAWSLINRPSWVTDFITDPDGTLHVAGIPDRTGLFTYTVTASTKKKQVSRTVNLNIVEDTSSNFNLVITPPSRTVIRGQGTSFSILVESVNGFSTPVTLGAMANAFPLSRPDPNPVIPGNTSTLKIEPVSIGGLQEGTYSITITGYANDPNDVHVSTCTLVVVEEDPNPKPVLITTTDISNLALNEEKKEQLEAQGGFPPYIWSVSGGSAANFASIDPATGILTRKVSIPGTYSLEVEVRDSHNNNNRTNYNFTVREGATNDGVEVKITNGSVFQVGQDVHIEWTYQGTGSYNTIIGLYGVHNGQEVAKEAIRITSTYNTSGGIGSYTWSAKLPTVNDYRPGLFRIKVTVLDPVYKENHNGRAASGTTGDIDIK